ncbi:MAG: VWA domain-containing protein [Terracidiphilus sp.]
MAEQRRDVGIVGAAPAIKARLFTVAMALLLSGQAAGLAQQLPPIEPPKPMPGGQADMPVLHVTTNEVLVPALVEKHDGEIVYGLKASDFLVEDNGVRQTIHVQEEMDTAPVSLVIAVEEGGASVLEFGKLAHLGPLLDVFLNDSQSRAALVGFDSKPYLIRDFTHSTDSLDDALKHLEPGDGGAAILDTVSYAVDLLQSEPEENRRVLLLISERRDHGSKHTKPEQLIRKIGRSNVLVLSVSFSPSGAELLHDVQDSGEDRTMNMVSALVMAVKAFKKNVAKEIAQESGGEYTTFVGDKRFEQRVVDAAKHMRNRYLITFSPSDPVPGLHTLRVQTTENLGVRIIARSNYWLEGAP